MMIPQVFHGEFIWAETRGKLKDFFYEISTGIFLWGYDVKKWAS